jgi:predicted permease
MSAFWHDLRYAVRLLRFSPGFTFVALLTLALGIGANTAIFQLIDAIRLRTIPARNPEELATIRIADRNWGSGSFSGQYSQLTFPLWEQIRKRQEGFSAFSAWGEDQFNLATGGEVHYARGIWVSGEFFDVLGIRPFWGRLLSATDDLPGCGAGGAVLSYAFWQRNYGGDPAAVGKRLTLNGNSFEIIGITPPSFTGVSIGNFFDVAIPPCSEPILHKESSRLPARDSWWLATIGRLKPGWTVDRATAQIKAASPAILQETVPPRYDASMQKKYLEYRLAAYPASKGFSELREQSETPLWLLLGISCLVLLIACANLANLMLARASARQRQLSIRLVLGASRGQLIRQLLSESLLLAAGGAVSGTLLAVVISRALVSFISTPNKPIFLDTVLDWRVLAFTSGLAILTTALFGLTPALRVTRCVPNTFLQAEGRGNHWRPGALQPSAHPSSLPGCVFGRFTCSGGAFCAQSAEPADVGRGVPTERRSHHECGIRAVECRAGTPAGIQARFAGACANDPRSGIRCRRVAGTARWRLLEPLGVERHLGRAPGHNVAELCQPGIL